MTTLYRQEVTEELVNEYRRKWLAARDACKPIARKCKKTGNYKPLREAHYAMEEAFFDYRMANSLLMTQWLREEQQMDAFVRGYVECLLWAEGPGKFNGEDTDASYQDLGFVIADCPFEAGAWAAIKRDCAKFVEKNGELIDDSEDGYESAGHDFWLTRQGHGCGFWDGDWPKHGDALTKSCEEFGEVYLYEIGGKVYISGEEQ